MKQLLEQPLVSVIIPTYNRADLIGHTLESVINQSYRNLEIIVIDDGSVDNTEEVVKAIGDSRIRYIRHQTNCGGSTARNTGVEAARGEYIAFLDSDDIWVPNKIQLQLASIQMHPHSERVVSYTQRAFGRRCQVVSLPRKLSKTGKGETEALADYLFCNGGDMQTSTLMMHRSLGMATHFRPELRKHQDWDFCLRLEANGAIFTFIEKPLTIWNNEPRSDQISRIADYQISISWIREYSL